MKCNGIPGEFAFKALIAGLSEEIGKNQGWRLTEERFFSLEEVRRWYTLKYFDIKWPVEVYEDGSIYIPDQSELE